MANKAMSQLLPDPLPPEPLQITEKWLRQAWDEQVQPNPNAMVLATVGAGGQPSARVVLAKDLMLPDGYVMFYTNYDSRKAAELAANPRATGVLYWDTVYRQVRVEGFVVKSPAAESDDYFATRPWQSRVGAWASQQSRPIGSRAQLIEQWRAAAKRFDTPPVGPDADEADDDPQGVEVPRPPNWGGYRLWVEAVELWIGGEYRIHDRARWTRTLTPLADGHRFHSTAWHVTRLQP
ncbi:MAG: pyridoxamine 5'-phosphate oxidase [Steroidobacteraceae bacterium]|jgi:pyridoxamine 5'-phosphate oxidase|nr:pyridoxamine 5'-phosphate oxidase [Steroidobacteraceae bacterium]